MPAPSATPEPLRWHAEDLWQQLLPLLPGLNVEVVARMGSTNTELLARARGRPADGVPPDLNPCLLVAEQQTQGRGRQGKAWVSGVGGSALGTSLTFSLALPLAPGDWSGLSLAVGLALAEALDPGADGQPPRLGLKWPNDLLLLDGPINPHGVHIGRKLGGILIETVQVGGQRVAVIGIGLNILPLPDGAEPAALGWGYGCLDQLQAGLSAPTTLARVALPLVQALQAFERDGFAPLQARFARRDVLAGRELSTTLADLPQGRADGVDARGALWLQAGGVRRSLNSGEVSLRPLAGAHPPATATRPIAPC